jgi:peptidoglycan/LPS O-acetylase OafA/YrhL
MVGLQFAQAWDPTAPGKIAPYLADTFTIQLTTVFLVGAVLAVYADRIPMDDRLGVAAGVVVVLTLRNGGFLEIGAPVGAYFVLWLAARTPARLRWVGQRTDISYGVYIYGFLVEQVLAFAHADRAGYWPFLLLSIVVSYAIGWVSWHAIEGPAMKLKGRGPGRGFWTLWSAATKRRRTLRHPSTVQDEPTESEVEPVRA